MKDKTIGTLHMVRCFCTMQSPESDKECKKNILSALGKVSEQLGNTRTVCKKYYVHPSIIKLYEQQALNKYLKELDIIEKPDDMTGLTSEEKIMMKILNKLV